MLRLPTRLDLDERSHRLTPNEYHASARNHLEYNRLQNLHRAIQERNDVHRYKFSRNTTELKHWLNNQQTYYGSRVAVVIARQVT